MMNELLLPQPDTVEMKHKQSKRCDNKYFVWLVVTILGLGLFITGFRYSGHKKDSNSFLNKLPFGAGNSSDFPTESSPSESQYYGTPDTVDNEVPTEASEYENPATEYGTPDTPVSTVEEDVSDKSYVLILTEGRAGSTWLSSFFWNTPDTFYVYEPLHYTPALHEHHCHDSAAHRRGCTQEILSNIYTCDFESSELTVLGQYPSYRKKCKDCTTVQLQDECRRSNIIIPKVASQLDMNDLEDLIVNKLLDVRVVHLVRDARPLVQARSTAGYGTIDGFHQHPADGYSDEMLSEESQVLCDRVLAASKLGDNPPSWLSGRYKRVTYEAISANPIAVAKDVYSYANLPWNAQIEQGIYNSTTAKGIPDTDAWKTTMSQHSIDIVSESCKGMLEYLGYLNPVPPQVDEVGVGDEIQSTEGVQDDGEPVQSEPVQGDGDPVQGGSVQGEEVQGEEVHGIDVQSVNSVELDDIPVIPITQYNTGT